MRPSWDDPRLGSRARVALWLADVVGEGNVFTKTALRETFPAVEQIDRRMRDLRAYGWRIDTNAQDSTLAPNELRLVAVGQPVWERLPAAERAPRVSARKRKEVLAQFSHLCASCGISHGEPYADEPHMTATLHVVVAPTGDYVAECARCRKGGPPSVAVTTEVRAELDALNARDRQVLARWASLGRREPSQLDLVWARLRLLPPEDQARVLREVLRDATGDVS